MLNGVFQVLMGQFLLFLGFWFSIATLGDCNFITLDSVDDPWSDGIIVRIGRDGNGDGNGDGSGSIIKSNKIGLLSYLDPDTDQCYYWTNQLQGLEPFTTMYGTDQIIYYIQTVLGSNWYPVISLCGLAAVLSFMTFLYIISYCCSTQVRGVRSFTGLFISIIITLCQVIGTYLIYDSNWCNDEFKCTIGRSTIFSIVASCCYFVSGLFFIFMTDYPGKKRLKEIQDTTTGDVEEEEGNNNNDDDMNADASDIATGAAAATTALPKDENEDKVVYDEEVGRGGIETKDVTASEVSARPTDAGVISTSNNDDDYYYEDTEEDYNKEEEEVIGVEAIKSTTATDYTAAVEDGVSSSSMNNNTNTKNDNVEEK